MKGILPRPKTSDMKKSVILFDLDGTLTDSEQGIINSVAHALEKSGVKEYDRALLRAFIGPPLVDCFMKYFNFSEERSRAALDYFREYFTEKGIYENSVYPGIPELLKKLKAAGYTVGVATCKPEVFAKKILDRFCLLPNVDLLAGATLDEKRNSKPEVIKYAIDTFGFSPESAVMVGDRDCDITGAHRYGLTAVGVLYGYGGREELLSVNPDRLADSVEELGSLLLSGEL